LARDRDGVTVREMLALNLKPVPEGERQGQEQLPRG
jgi:hypothetical protein